MRLELNEFVQATRSMHQQPGRVKRMRLMLRLRPYQSRKVFLLKATDGRVTMTTRVEHQGQLRLVESLVNEFVSDCTRASVGSPVPPTVAASASEQQTASAAAELPVSSVPGHKDRGAGGVAAATATRATGQAGAGSSASRGQAPACVSQASSSNAGRQNKGRKGRRH
ncbi:hypothetical protein Q4I30_000784 [Leishmania utingensis]|uniref:SRP9 domain-containing protein n=1 Tax=Leishmania utingensis TaxID=653362 RepID=A0AAW3AYG9_9TRYP